MNQYEVTFAGFGGQGIMTAGQLLAYAGIAEGKFVAWIPSYGPEMRGGTAYCTVVVSDTRIGSPIVTNPRGICVFNRPSFDKFEPRVKANGLFIVNSSLIDVTTSRKDINEILVPANEIALMEQNVKATNLAILGAFIGATDVVDFETMKNTITQKLGKRKELLKSNLAVFDRGYELAQKHAGQKEKA